MWSTDITERDTHSNTDLVTDKDQHPSAGDHRQSTSLKQQIVWDHAVDYRPCLQKE